VQVVQVERARPAAAAALEAPGQAVQTLERALPYPDLQAFGETLKPSPGLPPYLLLAYPALRRTHQQTLDLKSTENHQAVG